MEPTWFRWLENIRDWCISRQLWWGHRIPAYYVKFEGEEEDDCGMPGGSSEKLDRWVIGREEDEARAEAEKKFPGKAFTLEQDEDVLDTWFSSGLFPFSVFGWPDETPDLAEFYPTALLETGHDIMFFWVARMVMMGMKLTGKVPFKQVYLHAMVRDAHGRKMSKSLGNVIDPLHVIEGITLSDLNETLTGGNLEEKEVKKAQEGQAQDYPDGIPECGTDAMRFALVAYTAQGRDINLDVLRVVGYRHWCNKLWNAIRFAIMNLGDGYEPPETPLTSATPGLPPASKWALHRLNTAVKTTVDAMEVYDFANATTGVYAFWQYDVCDVFIELMKPVMNGTDEVAKKATRDTLWTCLDAGLRLLHPFMPFVTEELWQRLPRRAAETAPSIMVADYPAFTDDRTDNAVEESMAVAQEIVKATRSLRAAYNLPPKTKAELFIVTRGDAATDAAKQFSAGIAALATCAKVDILCPDDAVPAGCGVTVINESVSVYLMLKGVVDPAAEIAKLEKKSAQTAKQIADLQKKMEMPGYETKVPENVRADNTEKLAKLEAEVATTAAAMEDFKKLI
jgi:valyl-tRNA synthetase